MTGKAEEMASENVKSSNASHVAITRRIGETLRNVGYRRGEHPVMDGKPHRIRVEEIARSAVRILCYAIWMAGQQVMPKITGQGGNPLKSQGAVLSTRSGSVHATCECKQAEWQRHSCRSREHSSERQDSLSMRENVDALS